MLSKTNENSISEKKSVRQNFTWVFTLYSSIMSILFFYLGFNKVKKGHANETSRETLNQNKKEVVSKTNWDSYHDLEINSDLFKRGIIAVRPYMFNPPKQSITDGTHFTLSSRELLFGNSENKTGAKKTIKLLNNLEKFYGQQGSFEENQNIVIFNKTRREEMFLPILVKDMQEKNFGFYIYPWLSLNSNDFKFSGFKQFVIAGCIFGSSLKGRDQYGGAFELIKHDIKFYAAQKIVDIEFNLKAFSPYEITLFSEFEKLALLIKRLAKRHETVRLYYHLPSYDYILFGVELFLRGRITLSALDLFFKAVFLRKSQHINEINRICKIHEIEVNIESPFENLFGILSNEYECTKFILNKLELCEKEIEPELNEKLQNENEKMFVQYCLDRLKTNAQYENHRQTWESFISIGEFEITNLEQLFKMANAVMVALACKDKKDYETCSLLPLSEKQIQVSYADLNKKLNNQYPAVFNITTLDPLVSYDNNNNGLLFYFRNCQETLAKLITKRKILDRAHENISHYVTKKDPLDIETILTKQKNV